METVLEKKIGRNDPCSCGSGKKYKKCCLNKTSIVDTTSDSNKKEKLSKQTIEGIQHIMETSMDVWEKNFPRDQFDGTDQEYQELFSDYFNSLSKQMGFGIRSGVHSEEEKIKMDQTHEFVDQMWETWKKTDRKMSICTFTEESKFNEMFLSNTMEYLLRDLPIEVFIGIDDNKHKNMTVGDYQILQTLREKKEEMINNSILIER